MSKLELLGRIDKYHNNGWVTFRPADGDQCADYRWSDWADKELRSNPPPIDTPVRITVDAKQRKFLSGIVSIAGTPAMNAKVHSQPSAHSQPNGHAEHNGQVQDNGYADPPGNGNRRPGVSTRSEALPGNRPDTQTTKDGGRTPSRELQIIRQSSIKSAIELTIHQKGPQSDVDSVLDIAARFEAWVIRPEEPAPW